VYIFFDSEFTALDGAATLLSFGAVSADGREFYCELDPLPLATCSAFVHAHVLPLFAGGAHSCPRGEFARRLAAWLAQFADPLLLADSDWDIYVLRQAVDGERSRRPGLLELPGADGRVACLLVTLAPLGADELARFDATLAQHFAGDPRQHHALVDARALRAGLLAVQALREAS
jgi:hypothetical protein